MMTILILLGCVSWAVFLTILAACALGTWCEVVRPHIRENRRKQRLPLGRLLRVSHPEWK